MMSRALATGAILLLLASPALAFSCPKHMAEIDAALAKNPSISAEAMAEVKKLRTEGEQLHDAGKHQESVDALLKAKDVLGMK